MLVQANSSGPCWQSVAWVTLQMRCVLAISPRSKAGSYMPLLTSHVPDGPTGRAARRLVRPSGRRRERPGYPPPDRAADGVPHFRHLLGRPPRDPLVGGRERRPRTQEGGRRRHGLLRRLRPPLRFLHVFRLASGPAPARRRGRRRVGSGCLLLPRARRRSLPVVDCSMSLRLVGRTRNWCKWPLVCPPRAFPSAQAEVMPTKSRGRFMVLLASFWMVGSIFTALAGWCAPCRAVPPTLFDSGNSRSCAPPLLTA